MGDVANLTAKAYEIARMIPHGMVTSYGKSATDSPSPSCFCVKKTAHVTNRTHSEARRIPKLLEVDFDAASELIAYAIAENACRRHVGNALRDLPSGTDIPWQASPLSLCEPLIYGS